MTTITITEARAARFIATGAEGDTGFGRLTLRVIQDAMLAVVTNLRDRHLYYIERLDHYGAGDAETLPLPDAFHPDTRTHSLMGQCFAGALRGRGLPEPSTDQDELETTDELERRSHQQA